jgi:adenine phosphoribosyltransferase
MKSVEDYIKCIPDFPEPGVLFRDVTSVIEDPEGFKLAIDEMDKLIGDTDFDMIVGAEARGFIFGAPLAYKRGKGLALVRKKGKLPRETVSVDYDLEYGSATVELHKDTIKPGQKVILVDDLLATGGTIGASAKLVESLGGVVVKAIFLIELEGLNGRAKLADYDVNSVVSYSGK